MLAKILYASPAWWGFTSAADRQRIEAFVRCGVRLGLYRASDPLTQLIADNDNNRFRKMLYNEHHVLKQLLPDETNHQYHLRQRRRNLCLTAKTDDRNFVTRQQCLKSFIDSIFYFF